MRFRRSGIGILWLIMTLVGLAGCGSGGGPAPSPSPVAKAADFSSAELAGHTLYIATPANASGTYDSYSFNADGSVSGATGISATGAGTPFSGTWSVSSGQLQLTLPGKGAESFIKTSASPDSDGAFTVVSSSGGTTMKWYYNQINGGAQALACATGATIPAPVTLLSLEVTPGNLTTTVGWTQQFTAIGRYSDNASRDLSATVAWSSSDTGVASIAAGGLATAVAAGPATITAACGGISAKVTVAITYDKPVLQSLSISPGGYDQVTTLAIGGTQQFRVVGHYTGNATQDLTSQLAWSSSDPAIATVTGSGLVTGIGTGMTRIHADAGPAVSGASTVIYSGETVVPIAGAYLASGFADGAGDYARFSDPSAITTDGTYLYVTDTGNNCIRKVAISTGAVTTLAGSPSAWGAFDGTGSSARFYGPSGISTDGTNLFVSDTMNNTIRKIVIASGVVTTIAGSPGVSGAADGTGAQARFNGPTGITTDRKALYVADSGNNAVRRIDLATNEVTTLATAATFSDLGVAATGMRGMTSDGVNVYGIVTYYPYVSSAYIFKIALPSGTVSLLPAAQPYRNPIAIATDGATLYVTDDSTHHGYYVNYKMPLQGGTATQLTTNTAFFDNQVSGLAVMGKTIFSATGFYHTVAGIRLE